MGLSDDWVTPKYNQVYMIWLSDITPILVFTFCCFSMFFHYTDMYRWPVGEPQTPSSQVLSSGRGVLDVAGGQGDLSWQLSILETEMLGSWSKNAINPL